MPMDRVREPVDNGLLGYDTWFMYMRVREPVHNGLSGYDTFIDVEVTWKRWPVPEEPNTSPPSHSTHQFMYNLLGNY